MPTPLLDLLNDYREKHRTRLHTPGHQGRGELFGGVFSYDVTELPETDDLFFPGPVLREAAALAARAFGSGATWLSAGGASPCVRAMLLLTCPPGSEVALDRRCHVSALQAVISLDLRPVWLLPDRADALGVISPEAVEEALEAHPALRAVLLTSPSYYGALCDLPAASALCRARDIPLLVDNAHGSHLAYWEGLHPLAQGADLVTDSLHKTLPVMTGGALLHSGTSRFDQDRLREALAFFSSTSPSFPVLASLDWGRDYMEREGGALLHVRQGELEEARETLQKTLPGLAVSPARRDPLRLTLDAGRYGMDGRALARRLLRDNFACELSDRRYVTAIITAMTPPGEAARLCRCAAEHLAGRSPRELTEPPLPRPQAALPPRQGYFAPFEEVPLGRAAGRICARPAYVSPPCIPLLVPGERVTDGALEAAGAAGLEKISVIV